MSPEVRRKLVGVLGMLASTHDGERAAAGLLASRLLKSAGVTWEQVIPEQPATTIHRDRRQPPAGNSTIAFCLERDWQLTAWECQFLESIITRRALSPKQAAILDRIYDKVREDRP